MYLCLSILLCRISLLLFLLALGDTSLVISHSPPNVHPLGELATLHNVAASGPVVPAGPSPLGNSLDLQGSSNAPVVLTENKRKHQKRALEIHSEHFSGPHVPDVVDVNLAVNSGPVVPTEKKRKHQKRVLDNHTGPIIRPHVPDFVDANLAIVSTLDGHLHCIDNRDGSIFWTRGPQASGAVVSSNRFSMRPEASSNELLAHSVGGAPRLEGQPGKQSTEDLTFIVEPSETPQLYVYSNISGLQVWALARPKANLDTISAHHIYDPCCPFFAHNLLSFRLPPDFMLHYPVLFLFRKHLHLRKHWWGEGTSAL